MSKATKDFSSRLDVKGLGKQDREFSNMPHKPDSHDVAALPEILQDEGYHTLISGKWHLGLRPENNPAVRGFDRSFSLLPGTSNHYGWEPQFGKDYLNFFVRIPPLYTEDGRKYDMSV